MFEQTFKNIDDVLWKEAGCATELDYTEQTSWMLFLKYLDDLERERALEAQLHGKAWNQPPKSEFVYEPRKDYVRLLQIRDFTVSQSWSGSSEQLRA